MNVFQKPKSRVKIALVLSATSIAAVQCATARPVGIDVSSYQGSPSWSSIKSCGWTFAWAKATEGATINDGSYRYNINNAKANGVYVGAYHFAHPNLNSPATESSHFWGVISGDVAKDGKSLSPVLDFEVFSGVTGASSYTAWADAFNNAIVSSAKAKGVTVNPILYTSSCSACNFSSAIGSWVPWIADYNGQSSQTGSPWSVCGSCDIWNKWTIWQYSSSGSVCGVSGSCDVDVFNGSSSSLVTSLVIDGDGSSSFAPAPAAVSWGSGRIDVIVRGGGDAIYHKYYVSGQGWLPNGPTGSFERLGGVSEYGPGIASWAVNRLDAFCIATDDSLQHKYWNGSSWLPDPHWENLDGGLNSSPAAVSWGSGRIDVVARGGSNHIYHKYYIDGQGWLPSGHFEDIGGNSTSSPAICSWGSGNLDVFYRGTDNALKHLYYRSGAWNGPEDLGGTLTSGPAAVSPSSGRIDVFVRGGQNHIYHKYYISGQGWLPNGSFNDIGGNATSPPGVCSMGADSYDVFYRGTDNNLKHLYWRGSSWLGPEDLGGTLE